MKPEDYLVQYLRIHCPNKKLYNEFLKRPEGDVAKELARDDCSFFCKYYLSHYFNKPYSVMHKELFQDIHRMKRSPHGLHLARASPRESAKSTTVDIGQTLWHIANQSKRYIMLCKDTGPQANLELGGVKDELTTNSYLKRDFPEMCGEGKKWKESEVITRNGIMVQAVGAGMKLRGRRFKHYRPDLVIFDDIENLENTGTQEQREKLKKWLMTSAMNVGTSSTDYFMIGTILHTDSLLVHILENPTFLSKTYQAVLSWADYRDLWDNWERIYLNLEDLDRHLHAQEYFEKNRTRMMQGASVQWPEGQSYYFLMTKLLSIGRTAFDMEFQNDPVSLEDALFRSFHFYHLEDRVNTKKELEPYLVPDGRGNIVRLADCTLYGACDPSLGKTQHSDYSAIVVVAKSRYNRLFTLEADLERRHPNKIIDDIFKLILKYTALGMSFSKFAVESNQFQEFFKDQVAERSQREGLFLNLEEVRSSKNKDMRIQSLEPDVNNGYILFDKKQKLLLNQLRYYPKADHDDGPDALEMVRDLARGGGWSIGSA